jgi:hypothetical protein
VVTNFFALSEAFRRLNIDPHRSPSVTIVPVNGDERIIMEAEHMDICITSNEVHYVEIYSILFRSNAT